MYCQNHLGPMAGSRATTGEGIEEKDGPSQAPEPFRTSFTFLFQFIRPRSSALFPRRRASAPNPGRGSKLQPHADRASFRRATRRFPAIKSADSPAGRSARLTCSPASLPTKDSDSRKHARAKVKRCDPGGMRDANHQRGCCWSWRSQGNRSLMASTGEQTLMPIRSWFGLTKNSRATVANTVERFPMKRCPPREARCFEWALGHRTINSKSAACEVKTI